MKFKNEKGELIEYDPLGSARHVLISGTSAPAKARSRVAIAFARKLASELIKNTEPIWQQGSTNLSDEELDLVTRELEKISKTIEASIDTKMLANAYK
ncbi:hypothetical protein ACI2KR_06795 [Pseudomonas luteola]